MMTLARHDDKLLGLIELMALGHAKTGVVVGLVAADLAHTSIIAGLALTMLTAGAALLPDLDHPSATAARAFGPVTELIAGLLDRAGVWIYNATATRYDRRVRDGHRTITHTAIFALLAGTGVGALDAAVGRWALLGTLFVLASLAVRGLTASPRRDPRAHRVLHRVRVISRALHWSARTRKRAHRFHANALSVSAYAIVFTAACYFAVPQIDPLLLGECVALGCWTHCLGDSCTLAGCPWLWPLRIKGRHWYPIGTPQFLRFRTGGNNDGGVSGEYRFGVALNLAIIAAAAVLIDPWVVTVIRDAHGAYNALTP
jgi:membrane-bound metal-dependent hydrolase YbcI (DUF457 family)